MSKMSDLAITIVEMLDDGYPVEYVAAELEVSLETVQEYANHLEALQSVPGAS